MGARRNRKPRTVSEDSTEGACKTCGHHVGFVPTTETVGTELERFKGSPGWWKPCPGCSVPATTCIHRVDLTETCPKCSVPATEELNEREFPKRIYLEPLPARHEEGQCWCADQIEGDWVEYRRADPE